MTHAENATVNGTTPFVVATESGDHSTRNCSTARYSLSLTIVASICRQDMTHHNNFFFENIYFSLFLMGYRPILQNPLPHWPTGDVVPNEGSDIAEEPVAEAAASVAETDSVGACGLLSKLAITVATGWLIY